MKFFFSPLTTAFFRSDINGEPGDDDNSLAADAIEVPRELYEQMLLVREQGGRVIAGKGGKPIAAPPLPPTDAEQVEKARRWRDSQLTVSEWVVTRHRDEVDMAMKTTITTQQFSGLLKYRQALRDWPTAEGFPSEDLRPNAPDWLADQAAYG
ncbi:phage tail assembly chaperone [Pseudomonas sp. NPDC078863]|uniref:phage tail assembly chaperone n=1 Tax=Pseudomonas sp. NPDC078863 TaxID=3364425 RepID=UPI0037CA14CF